MVGHGKDHGNHILLVPVDVGGQAAHDRSSTEVGVKILLIVNDEVLGPVISHVVAHIVVLQRHKRHLLGSLLGLLQGIGSGTMATEDHYGNQRENQRCTSHDLECSLVILS